MATTGKGNMGGIIINTELTVRIAVVNKTTILFFTLFILFYFLSCRTFEVIRQLTDLPVTSPSLIPSTLLKPTLQAVSCRIHRLVVPVLFRAFHMA